jgi:hypothetical protein
MPRRTMIIGSTVAIGAILLALFAFPSYTDYAFACEYTCSHMGYRQWVLGFKTREWYDKSPIERRLGDEELRHRWVSYAGTTYNGFGMTMSRGHSKPHAAALFPNTFWPCFESLSDEQLRAFYESVPEFDTWRERRAFDESMLERLYEYLDLEN